LTRYTALLKASHIRSQANSFSLEKIWLPQFLSKAPWFDHLSLFPEILYNPLNSPLFTFLGENCLPSPIFKPSPLEATSEGLN
jgi:hypothetical protein